MKRKKLLFIIIFVISLLTFYLYYQNHFLEKTNYIIESDSIPISFNNYKIVQLSDYHNETSKKLNTDLLHEIQKVKPNIIVITGDLIDSKRTNLEVAIKFVGKLNDIAPVYLVAGNHEARIENYNTLKQELLKEGCIILENETSIIEINDNKINLIGIQDPQMAHDAYAEDSAIIETALKNSKYDSNLFSILLSHRPELFETYVHHDIDLVLTGHAHGGQIRIPFIGGIIAPNQGFFPNYTNGLFNKNNTYMVVNRGIGNSLFPFRINNRPEFVTITLKTTK